jgi:hypothetical protein
VQIEDRQALASATGDGSAREEAGPYDSLRSEHGGILATAMTTKTQSLLVFTFGLAVFPFFWWLSGAEIPRERGSTMVFFVLETPLVAYLCVFLFSLYNEWPKP